MAFKGWFRSGGSQGGGPLEIDDLIVLERYEAAEERLRAKLKTNPGDLHAHLKLAEVFMRTHQQAKAIDEYVFIAEEYADDGFYEKGIALLAKVQKLVPDDGTLAARIERLQKKKRLEQSRVSAIEGLLRGQGITGHAAGSTTLELQRLWRGLEGSPFVERLAADELRRLFAAMRLGRLELGTVLAEQGALHEEAFLIADGEVATEARLGDGRQVQLRSFSAGDLIGDRALLERKPWPATYRAIGEVAVLTLGREGLEQTLSGNPDPRGFLEVLRCQHHDRDVEQSIRRLAAAAPSAS